MRTNFLPGEFLFDESTARPFITDGTINADGYGVLIGYTAEGRLCRSSGQGNFQKDIDPRYATREEKEWLINQIRIAKDIPFYSCI